MKLGAPIAFALVLILGTGWGCNETGNDAGNENSCSMAAECMIDMCQVEIEQWNECELDFDSCIDEDGADLSVTLLEARTNCLASCDDGTLTDAQRQQAESQAIVCTIPENGQENCDMRTIACADAG